MSSSSILETQCEMKLKTEQGIKYKMSENRD